MDLPSDVLALIFGHLNAADCRTVLFLVHQACRQWRQVCRDKLVAHFDLSWATTGGQPWARSNPLTDTALRAMIDRFHAVSRLTLAYCCRLSESFLPTLGTRHLVALDLEGSQNLTNAALRLIVRQCPNLMSIGLGHCAQISDEGVADLAESCGGLKHVDLKYCSLVSDSGISALKRCCWLSSLNLRLLRHVTDECLKSISTLPGLLSLDLYGCLNITDVGLASLAAGRCTFLEYVNFSHCSKVSDRGLRTLQSAFPRVKCDAQAVGCVERVDAFDLRGVARCLPMLRTARERLHGTSSGAVHPVGGRLGAF
jgi:hypothetical protein